MKNIKYQLMIGLSLLAASNSIIAQDSESKIRTLIGNDHKIDHGGWGAPTLAYTNILDQDALLVGIRGGWIIDHVLTIGIAGYGLVTEVNNAAYDEYLIEQGRIEDGTSRFQTGYGGLLIEPIIAYSSPIHVSLPIIIGAGGYGYTRQHVFHEWDNESHSYIEDAHAFFVLESGIDLEFNIIPILRLGLGVSYRYTSDLQMEATPADALQGWNGSMSIKIGAF